jgi:formyltetrahydrofolate deformylase
MNTFILLFQCQDAKGIVASVSDFILRHSGNIIIADQYSTDPESGHFFLRVEFVLDSACSDKASLEKDLAPVAAKFNAQCRIFEKKKSLRVGILVSRPDHCLFDLLYLWRSQELKVEIPFVVSNYQGHRELVQQHRIPFYYLAATKQDTKEPELLDIVTQDSDFLVLARYMLLLSADFLKKYGKDIINIHHGFLPSFKGAKPYRQALASGVKIIGATSHFVTEKLDEGPIISQAVEPVSHKDDLDSLIRKGKNLEKRALADALQGYLDYRVIRYNNKTIVF